MVDPRISLAVEPAKLIPFSDLVKNRIAIQSAEQQRQANQQAMELNQVRADQERLDNDILRKKIANQQEDEADDAIYHQVLSEAPADQQDWGKIRGALAAKVKPRNLARYEAEAAKSIDAWGKVNTEKRKQVADQQKLMGDALISVKAAAPEQRQALWSSERARLAVSGAIDPTKVPEQVPDDNGLDALIRQNGAWGNYLTVVDKEHKAKVAELKEREDRETKMHAEFATAAQGIEDAADWDAAVKAFADKDPEHKAYADRFLRSLKFNKGVTEKVVNKRAMTADQRQRADDAAANRVNRRKTGLEISIDRARDELGEDAAESDIIALGQKYFDETERNKKIGGNGKGGVAKDDRGFTRTQVAADQGKHEALQSSENAQWRLAEAYDSILKKPDGTMVTDPSSKSLAARPLDADMRANFKRRLDEARGKAEDFQRQKKMIREKHGWDQNPAQTELPVPQVTIPPPAQAGQKKIPNPYR